MVIMTPKIWYEGRKCNIRSIRGEEGGTGQREMLSCSVAAKGASVILSGCSEAGVSFWRCPKVEQEGRAQSWM